MTTLATIDARELDSRLRGDREFHELARYLTAVIKLRVDSDVLILTFVDGELTRVADVDSGFDSANILVEVPADAFGPLMEEAPRPFYQDFWSAKFHHGVRIEGDFDLMSAYYGVIRRLGQIMREQSNGVQR